LDPCLDEGWQTGYVDPVDGPDSPSPRWSPVTSSVAIPVAVVVAIVVAIPVLVPVAVIIAIAIVIASRRSRPRWEKSGVLSNTF
jgi:hypothetical protein